MNFLYYPYLWNISPSIIYILFIKLVFHIFYFLTGNLEKVFKFVRLIQFEFLPLSFLRLPLMGIINYDFNDFTQDERMIMINNIPIFKIGNNSNSQKILYIHGGGFISGDYMSFRSFCLEIYHRCQQQNKNIEIWFPCYSLYPENDINKMIDELNYIYSFSCFSHIIADSAGGYLALNIKNIKKDTKMILISPVFELQRSNEENNHKDINFNPLLVKKIFHKIDHKLENLNIENIEMYIFVSQNELFLNDSYQIYELNQKAILYLYNSYIHSLPLFWKYDKKANLSLQKLISIIII